MTQLLRRRPLEMRPQAHGEGSPADKPVDAKAQISPGGGDGEELRPDGDEGTGQPPQTQDSEQWEPRLALADLLGAISNSRWQERVQSPLHVSHRWSPSSPGPFLS